VTWRPLTGVRLTVKLALTLPLLPSVTVTSSTATCGRSSSSVIVPWPVGSLIVASTEPDRVTVKFSSISSSRSPATGTVIVCVVTPAAKVSVPLVVV
jgi:hypothetical protein